MLKYISGYQYALYLKKEIKEDEVVSAFSLLSFDKEQVKEFKSGSELYENLTKGWSRIQFFLFMNPDINRAWNGPWWYYYSFDDDTEESSWEDPGYKPGLADNYSELPTKELVERLKCLFDGKNKMWINIPHPEEIKIIKKGGRWRNKGKALKMCGSRRY